MVRLVLFLDAITLLPDVPAKVRLPDVVAFPVVPNTWNLAVFVAVPPIAKSSVIFKGERTPLFLWNN